MHLGIRGGDGVEALSCVARPSRRKLAPWTRAVNQVVSRCIKSNRLRFRIFQIITGPTVFTRSLRDVVLALVVH